MTRDAENRQTTWSLWVDKIAQLLGREPVTQDQLVEVLRDAQQRDLLDRDALDTIERVIQVSELRVRDVMIPRSQMAVIARDASPDEILPVVIDTAHSRFPVVDTDRDKVIGILLAKDLLRYFHGEDRSRFNLREMLRPAVFIPESKRLNVLLTEFRASRNHMAIVVDEYGGVAGLVTIEDVLEQIVGEIEDEHDVIDDSFVKQLDSRTFNVKATTTIEDFNEHFDLELDDDEFDTIGGLVLKAFGHLPDRGESVRIGDLDFKVLNADSRRVRLLQVKLRK